MSAEGRAQFWHLSLPACPGFTISAFEAGSTTPLSIWTDAFKSSAVTSVTADGNGFASFWGDGDYRLQVKDASGTLIQDLDNVRITADTATVWEGSNGTTVPAVTDLNDWHLFAKHDGAGTFQGLYLNDGTTYNIITASLVGGYVDPRSHGAVIDGVTDDTIALQAAADAALTAGLGLLIPSGTMLVTDVITISDAVSILGVGMTSIIKASGFSGTTTINSKTIDKPVLLIDGLNSGDTVSRFEGFQVDCDDSASYGIFFVGGAANSHANIRVNKAVKSGIVLDAVQNGVFTGCRSTRSQEYNWYVANGAAHNFLAGCHASAADLANVYYNTNTGFPGDGFVSFTEPTQNLWTKSVFERSYLGTAARRLHMVTGDRNTFSECNIANEATVVQVDIESGAGSNVFDRLRISMPNPTPLAVRTAGFQNRFSDLNINSSSATTNFVECSGQTIIERPIRSGVDPVTKWIANTGTLTNTRICMVTLFDDHGTTVQRPTSDVQLVDSIVPYFDSDLSEWIYWDYLLPTPDWRRMRDNGPAGAVGSDLTITSNQIDISAHYHRVGAGTLNYISTTGVPNGYILVLATDGSGTVTVNDNGASPPTGTASLRLNGSVARTLDDGEDGIVLMYQGTNWKELSFSDNG